MKGLSAAVKSIASYFPAKTLENEELAKDFGDWDAAKILAKTGIASRHLASSGECASDLGVEAARKLFATGVCGQQDIDFLLFCTQSPDYFLPATACVLQSRLGLPTHCGALDFNQGCSGFVYGLSLAKGLVETGAARNVLLITAETYSKFINPRDRSARTIFGDGAAATLVSAVEADHDLIGPFVFGTDGRGAQRLIVPAGGMRQPVTPETAIEMEDGGNWRSPQNLYMDGPEIFNFTLRVVPAALKELLKRSGVELAQVDYFVFHQANKFMLDRLQAKLQIPVAKFCLYMETCGNTVSSTIPIALEYALRAGQVKPGNRVMLIGFGVGLSWAATMIEVSM